MSSINISNTTTNTATYAVKKNNQSEISSLIKERESMQKEVKSLQKELTSNSGDESETLEVQIETLQSQVSNIDSQIAKLQAEESMESSKGSSNNKVVESPSNKLDNPKELNTTLNKLDKNTELLENKIVLDKARGFNTEDKDEILSNMKKNIDNITSKLKEDNREKIKTISEDIEVVGNFVDSKA